ncbi:ATP-dependent RNA helicase A protein-like isoform X1 [Pseudophryne corroboree]|uniref:ATP-dependent RNA helicase A protein-like isoform X1 n=1 Tax=Pseudophryne corroboree TaxID=495146 RepID=UPI0030814734
MTDIKNFLYAWCGSKKKIPSYNSHASMNKFGRRITSEVQVDGYDYLGKGISNTKKESQRNAARDFVKYLVQMGEIKSDELPSIAAGQEDATDGFQTIEAGGLHSYFGGPLPDLTSQPEAGGAPAFGNTWYGPYGANCDYGANQMDYYAEGEEQEDYTLDSEDPDSNAELHGKWTLENAKVRLNSFFQKEKIPAKYKYIQMGPEHTRSFVAELTLPVKQLGLILHAQGPGTNKKLAAQSCALSMVRQLYHLGVIEPYSEQTKKKEEGAVVPYDVKLSTDDKKQLLDVLKELNIELPSPPQNPSQPVSLNLGQLVHTESSQQQSHSGVVAWSPPQENWNPWTSSNIHDGPLAFATQEQISADLKKERLEQDEVLQQIYSERESLPVKRFGAEILDAIRNHSVVIIQGATGCGKTTQVPQYILDEYIRNGRAAQCNIVVTQPRRISAVTVAERVAFERGEDVGKSCGFSVRFESILPRPHASVLFCTVGVLLRKLESGIRGISHVIVDEIHERDTNTDFLMVVLRDVIKAFPDIRVILMSATIDTTLFREYFFNCPIIEVHGRTFPVQEYFLEDCIEMTRFIPPPRKIKQDEVRDDNEINCNVICSDDYCPETMRSMAQMREKDTPFELIEALLEYIETLNVPGAVLVFLAGWNLIYLMQKHLQRNPHFGSHRYRILPLHSKIPRKDQRKVFLPAPDGVTKVILSTNIAETSITINDVVFVIDSCKQKIKLFTVHNNMTNFVTVWASKTNLEQRKGRAGRVRAGFSFHLCSRARYECLDANLTPEILRTPLHEVSLSIKLLRLGDIGEFLAKAIEPPPLDAVKEAERTLRELNALDANDELTPLGRILAKLPIEPRLGKMMIMGCILYVGDAVCTISAAACFPEPFISEGYRLADVHMDFAGTRFSDHVALLSVFQAWDDARLEGLEAEIMFCEERRLNMSTLRMMWEAKAQLKDILENVGFPEECLMNQVIDNTGTDNYLDVVISLMAFGMYPNICYHKEKRRILTVDGESAHIHLSSVTCPGSNQDPKYPSPFFVFSEKIRTGSITARGLTMVSPLQLLLFGPKTVMSDGERILLDDWFKLLMPHKDAACVTALRSAMEALTVEVSKDPTVLSQLSPVKVKTLNMIRLLSRPSTAITTPLMGKSKFGGLPRPPKMARLDSGFQDNQGGGFHGGSGLGGGNQAGGFRGRNQRGGFRGEEQDAGLRSETRGGSPRGGTQGGFSRGGTRDGDTRGRTLDGDSRGGTLGGDTRGWTLGGDTRGRTLGGDTRGRTLGGDTRGRTLGGDTRGRTLGGDSRGGTLGGDSRGGTLGGDARGGTLGGDSRDGTQAGYSRGGTQAGYSRGGTQAGYSRGGTQAGYSRGGTQAGYSRGGTQAGYSRGGTQGGYSRGGTQEVDSGFQDNQGGGFHGGSGSGGGSSGSGYQEFIGGGSRGGNQGGGFRGQEQDAGLRSGTLAGDSRGGTLAGDSRGGTLAGDSRGGTLAGDSRGGTLAGVSRGGTLAGVSRGGTLAGVSRGGTLAGVSRGGTLAGVSRGGTLAGVSRGGTLAGVSRGGTLAGVSRGGTLAGVSRGGTLAGVSRGGTLAGVSRGGTLAGVSRGGTLAGVSRGGTLAGVSRGGTQEVDSGFQDNQGGGFHEGSSLGGGSSGSGYQEFIGGGFRGGNQGGGFRGQEQDAGLRSGTQGGYSRGGTQGGYSRGGTQGGYSRGGTLGGDSRGGTLAGYSRGGTLAGYSRGGTLAGDSRGGTLAGDSRGGTLAGDSRGGTLAGDSRGGTLAGYSRGGTLAGDSRGGTLAGDSRGGTLAGYSRGGTLGGYSRGGTQEVDSGFQDNQGGGFHGGSGSGGGSSGSGYQEFIGGGFRGGTQGGGFRGGNQGGGFRGEGQDAGLRSGAQGGYSRGGTQGGNSRGGTQEVDSGFQDYQGGGFHGGTGSGGGSSGSGYQEFIGGGFRGGNQGGGFKGGNQGGGFRGEVQDAGLRSGTQGGYSRGGTQGGYSRGGTQEVDSGFQDNQGGGFHEGAGSGGGSSGSGYQEFIGGGFRGGNQGGGFRGGNQGGGFRGEEQDPGLRSGTQGGYSRGGTQGGYSRGGTQEVDSGFQDIQGGVFHGGSGSGGGSGYQEFIGGGFRGGNQGGGFRGGNQGSGFRGEEQDAGLRSGTQGDSPSGGTQGDSPSGGTQGDCPSGGTQGDGPSGGTQGDGPSGGTQGDGPSGETQGDCPSGGTQGDGPSGGTQGDSPSGGTQGDSPRGETQGDSPRDGTHGDSPRGWTQEVDSVFQDNQDGGFHGGSGSGGGSSGSGYQEFIGGGYRGGNQGGGFRGGN